MGWFFNDMRNISDEIIHAVKKTGKRTGIQNNTTAKLCSTSFSKKGEKIL